MNFLRNKLVKYICVQTVVVVFFITTCGPVSSVSAQTGLNLPTPGSVVSLSASFTPALITGINLNPQDPFQIDFIIHPGDAELSDEEFSDESMKMIKYFLAALTVPEKDMWVNLSPYEKERIIPDGFGDTVMGRDLLAQDYMLKQLTASLMSPDSETGAAFWQKVSQQSGVEDIPTETLSKVWIVPQRAKIYETPQGVFVVDSYLEVLLEEDYLTLANSEQRIAGRSVQQTVDNSLNAKRHTLNAEVMREIILPAIETEVNQGKTFAQLRQITNAVILANWYKENIQSSILNKIYADQNKTEGVDTEDKEITQKIYDQYTAAFRTGVNNLIKEEYDPATQQIIPRKYFSGGMNYASIENEQSSDSAMVTKMIKRARKVNVALTGRFKTTDRKFQLILGNNDKLYVDQIEAREITDKDKDRRTFETKDMIIKVYNKASVLFNLKKAKELTTQFDQRIIPPIIEKGIMRLKSGDRYYVIHPKSEIDMNDKKVVEIDMNGNKVFMKDKDFFEEFLDADDKKEAVKVLFEKTIEHKSQWIIKPENILMAQVRGQWYAWIKDGQAQFPESFDPLMDNYSELPIPKDELDRNYHIRLLKENYLLIWEQFQGEEYISRVRPIVRNEAELPYDAPVLSVIDQLADSASIVTEKSAQDSIIEIDSVEQNNLGNVFLDKFDEEYQFSIDKDEEETNTIPSLDWLTENIGAMFTGFFQRGYFRNQSERSEIYSTDRAINPEMFRSQLNAFYGFLKERGDISSTEFRQLVVAKAHLEMLEIEEDILQKVLERTGETKLSIRKREEEIDKLRKIPAFGHRLNDREYERDYNAAYDEREYYVAYLNARYEQYGLSITADELKTMQDLSDFFVKVAKAKTPVLVEIENDIQTKNVSEEKQLEFSLNDKAALDKEVGGIDMNPANIAVENAGDFRFEFDIDPAAFEDLPINGLVPVIINITPVTNIPLLLGRGESNPEEVTYLN